MARNQGKRCPHHRYEDISDREIRRRDVLIPKERNSGDKSPIYLTSRYF
ncbi:hypothetical protein [Sutcliffiella horikoshii]|nr:hypothetical protein [Sutcliffiella horikoshii]